MKMTFKLFSIWWFLPLVIIGIVLTLSTFYRDAFDDFDVDVGLNYSKYGILMGKKLTNLLGII